MNQYGKKIRDIYLTFNFGKGKNSIVGRTNSTKTVRLNGKRYRYTCTLLYPVPYNMV